MINTEALTKQITESKNFAYRKGIVELAFTLRVDIKDQLVIFRELLTIAGEDIDREIARIESADSGPKELITSLHNK